MLFKIVFFFKKNIIFFLGKMSRGPFVFNQFRQEKIIHEADLKYLLCYISSCLKSSFGESQKFWLDMFAYYQKAKAVCKWKRENNYLPLVKWGESIFQDKIVENFKGHKECICSKVYFKKR